MAASFQISEFTFHLEGPEEVEDHRGKRSYIAIQVEGTNSPFLSERGLHFRADYNDGESLGRDLCSHLYNYISSSWIDENFNEIIDRVAEAYSALQTPPS